MLSEPLIKGILTGNETKQVLYRRFSHKILHILDFLVSFFLLSFVESLVWDAVMSLSPFSVDEIFLLLFASFLSSLGLVSLVPSDAKSLKRSYWFLTRKQTTKEYLLSVKWILQTPTSFL